MRLLRKTGEENGLLGKSVLDEADYCDAVCKEKCSDVHDIGMKELKQHEN